MQDIVISGSIWINVAVLAVVAVLVGVKLAAARPDRRSGGGKVSAEFGRRAR